MLQTADTFVIYPHIDFEHDNNVHITLKIFLVWKVGLCKRLTKLATLRLSAGGQICIRLCEHADYCAADFDTLAVEGTSLSGAAICTATGIK